MKKALLLTIFCALANAAMAETHDGYNDKMPIFEQNKPNDGNYYRIPAMTTTSQGTVIVVGDHRPNGYDDIGMQDGIGFAIKVSEDGGKTWGEQQLLIPDTEITRPGEGTNKLGISDPAIVHDPNSGNTFLFGYQNDKWIGDKTGNFDFLMYTSKDGGKTWDEGQSMKHLLPEGYKFMLQGPGSGMSYNGTVYMAVQAWHHEDDTSRTCTSGYIYSEDGGKTWKASGMLRPENYPVGADGKPDVTSESNIFHHNGKIYLAAKPETSRESKKRVVYCTGDNGKTWERVYEDFIPDDVAQCESNTLSLNDQVYLVSYTKDKPARRNGLFITTNTGKTIQIAEGKVDGYTSMGQDEDNLYILFEESGGMSLKKYDIASKEYANVNAQILERGQRLLNAQDKLFASRSYLGGEYANNDANGAEAVVLNGNYKIGVFHKKITENSKDVSRTLEYDTKETTVVLSQDNVITGNDNIFIGYQYTDLEYKNGSKNDINSFVMGYSLNHKFADEYTYHLGLNGIYSNNKLDRNKLEGIGREADFDSYSISLRNELSKEFMMPYDINTKLSFGLDTTVFGHEKIEEEGGIKTVDGGKWNNATVDKSKNISNEIYAGTEINKNIYLNEKLTLKFGADAEYRKELMDVDDWRDDFTVLDVTKKYAVPVEEHEAGVVYAGVSVGFDIADKLETTISYRMDSTGENVFVGKVTYKF